MDIYETMEDDTVDTIAATLKLDSDAVMLLSTWFDNGLGKRFGSKTPMLAGSLLVLRLRNRQNAQPPLSPPPASPAASPASPPPSAASSSGGAEAVGAAALTPEEVAINSGLQVSSFGRRVHGKGKDKERSEGIRINDEYDRLRVEIESRQGRLLTAVQRGDVMEQARQKINEEMGGGKRRRTMTHHGVLAAAAAAADSIL